MSRALRIFVALALIACAALLSVGAQANTWNLATSITYRTEVSLEQGFSLWAYGIEDGASVASFQQAGGGSVTHNGHTVQKNDRYDFGLPGYTRILGMTIFGIDDNGDPRYSGANRSPGVGSQFVYYMANTGDAYGGPQEIASMGLRLYPATVTENYHVVNQDWMVSCLDYPNPPAGGAVETYHLNNTVRWTAPVEGDYQVTATWTGRKLTGSGNKDVEFDVNGVSQWTGTVNILDGSAATTWVQTVHLLQGQTVDSVTKQTGTSATAYNDYVAVNLVVQNATVPEPGSILMLGMGFIGLAAGVKLRKR